MEIERQVQERVLRITGKTINHFKGKQRDAESVVIRKCLFYMLREKGYTLKKIGKLFNRDHSTVIHGLDSVAYWKQMPKSYVYENTVLDLLTKSRPSSSQMLANLLSFRDLLLLNGSACYHFDSGSIFPSIETYKDISRPMRIKRSMFTVDEMLRRDGIIMMDAKHMDGANNLLIGTADDEYVYLKYICDERH